MTVLKFALMNRKKFRFKKGIVMKKILSFLATLLLVVGLTSFAQADSSMTVDGWTLDLNAITDAVNPTYNAALDGEITGITEIFYNGITWTQAETTTGVGRIDGLLSSLLYRDSNGVQQPWNDGNTLFYLTMDFSVNSVGNSSAWDHLAAGTTTGSVLDTTGILNIYLDLAGNASEITGTGYTDGILIAQFAILAGDGGTFDASDLDGHDDATFELIWAIDNLLLMADGTDLYDLIGTDTTALLHTDANYDADFDDNGAMDSVLGTTVWPGVAAAQTPISFLAKEDGSASLTVSTVPEPATMIFVGLGLLGIAGIGRKKISA